MKAVCNASPIITLTKAGMLDLLPALFDQVVVANAVVEEIKAGGDQDPAYVATQELAWLEQVALEPPASQLGVVNLGAGEAETIEWSMRNPDYVAILDDKAARRTAEALGVRCAGTLRILFEATRRGLIPSFAVAVERLRDAGLYCDPRTVEKLSTESPDAAN